jgi:large subunit ribosomal protein L10
MPTAEKAQVIEVTRDKFTRATGVVFTDYRGLKVKEMQELRATLRKQGGELHVVKNTLFRRAAGEAASNLPTELDNGTTAYAFVYENEPAVAKSLLDYARTSKKLVVKGALFGGKSYSAKDVESLSELPPRDILIAQVIGAIAAPLSNLVGVVEALYADPIRVIAAVADKVAEGSPLPEPTATPEAPAEEAPAAAPEPVAEAPETPADAAPDAAPTEGTE